MQDIIKTLKHSTMAANSELQLLLEIRHFFGYSVIKSKEDFSGKIWWGGGGGGENSRFVTVYSASFKYYLRILTEKCMKFS